jgi:hypothetical protein
MGKYRLACHLIQFRGEQRFSSPASHRSNSVSPRPLTIQPVLFMLDPLRVLR